MTAALIAYLCAFVLIAPGSLRQRIVNVLFSVDCLLFTVCTLGQSYPYESFSSAAWRATLHGRWYGRVRVLLDAVFWFDPNHCQMAYERAIFNLPEDMRSQTQ